MTTIRRFEWPPLRRRRYFSTERPPSKRPVVSSEKRGRGARKSSVSRRVSSQGTPSGTTFIPQQALRVGVSRPSCSRTRWRFPRRLRTRWPRLLAKRVPMSSWDYARSGPAHSARCSTVNCSSTQMDRFWGSTRNWCRPLASDSCTPEGVATHCRRSRPNMARLAG